MLGNSWGLVFYRVVQDVTLIHDRAWRCTPAIIANLLRKWIPSLRRNKAWNQRNLTLKPIRVETYTCWFSAFVGRTRHLAQLCDGHIAALEDPKGSGFRALSPKLPKSTTENSCECSLSSPCLLIVTGWYFKGPQKELGRGHLNQHRELHNHRFRYGVEFRVQGLGLKVLGLGFWALQVL